MNKWAIKEYFEGMDIVKNCTVSVYPDMTFIQVHIGDKNVTDSVSILADADMPFRYIEIMFEKQLAKRYDRLCEIISSVEVAQCEHKKYIEYFERHPEELPR